MLLRAPYRICLSAGLLACLSTPAQAQSLPGADAEAAAPLRALANTPLLPDGSALGLLLMGLAISGYDRWKNGGPTSAKRSI